MEKTLERLSSLYTVLMGLTFVVFLLVLHSIQPGPYKKPTTRFKDYMTSREDVDF